MATQPSMYTLFIQLEPLQIEPPVWRLIRVNSDCTLRKLHHFIQAAFGWHSCHLHEFQVGLNRYTPLDPEFADLQDDAQDDRRIKMTKVFKNVGRVRYTYDFGDSWQHVIALEAQEPSNVSGTWCEVLDGAGACPPEDVGGVPGYQDFLQVIAQPDSEEGQEALAWVGGHFDPRLFDCRAANAAVQRICNNLWG